jgi:N-acetyl sugar amidotransferase
MKEYTRCSRCILDTKDDPTLTFDEQGVCSSCRSYMKIAEDSHMNDPSWKKTEFEKIILEIRNAGKDKEYDCVIGVSGGVDSTYLAYLVKTHGLRPLAVHYDNGWNSEIAVKNIHNIVEKLGIDLHTYVNNWEEFRDLQVSFFKASVIDIELLTDQAIVAVLFNVAQQYGIRYVINGNNFATESILPKHWYHWKNDVLNIKSIQSKFGKQRLKTYPMVGFWKRWHSDKTGRVKTVSLLNYINYSKAEAKELISQKLDWKDYGGKHFESIFTRFYQAYFLPKKFGIDKRKAHLSSLICSGQMTRKEALAEMDKEIYPPGILKEDKEFVLKKLGFTEEEFERIMARPPKSHTDYASYITRHYYYQEKVSRFIKPIKNLFMRKST